MNFVGAFNDVIVGEDIAFVEVEEEPGSNPYDRLFHALPVVWLLVGGTLRRRKRKIGAKEKPKGIHELGRPAGDLFGRGDQYDGTARSGRNFIDAVGNFLQFQDVRII